MRTNESYPIKTGRFTLFHPMQMALYAETPLNNQFNLKWSIKQKSTHKNSLSVVEIIMIMWILFIKDLENQQDFFLLP